VADGLLHEASDICFQKYVLLSCLTLKTYTHIFQSYIQHALRNSSAVKSFQFQHVLPSRGSQKYVQYHLIFERWTKEKNQRNKWFYVPVS